MKFYEDERLQASTNNFFGDDEKMRGKSLKFSSIFSRNINF